MRAVIAREVCDSEVRALRGIQRAKNSARLNGSTLVGSSACARSSGRWRASSEPVHADGARRRASMKADEAQHDGVAVAGGFWSRAPRTCTKGGRG
eukprot:scaffold72798_cov52-Phaeocystis_antarctica.AAC.1